MVKKTNEINEDDSESGGKSGKVEFRDFLSSGERSRDDLLPHDEKRRLLAVHKESHETRVKKQKEVRDQRQALKEGKISREAYRQGMMQTGMNAEYNPAHPVLSKEAQFSGSIDRQVTALPSEHVAETNEENRNELENKYRLQNQPKNAPHFHPKPQYR